MSRPRTMPNGDLVYPALGSPPKEISGYTRDPGNPYVFHLDYEDCKHRKDQPYKTKCGRDAVCQFCKLKNRIVNPFYCNTCEEIET